MGCDLDAPSSPVGTVVTTSVPHPLLWVVITAIHSLQLLFISHLMGLDVLACLLVPKGMDRSVEPPSMAPVWVGGLG